MALALGLKLKLSNLTGLVASVITASMVAWHKFTASTWSGSNRLPDSSPVGSNTAALYTGRGLSFDGVNDVVTIGATGVTVKTVVFYAYPDTTTQAFMQLQATGAVRIEISSGTLSATGFTSPTLYVNGAASSTVAATTWQMIAVTSATGVSASNLLLGQSNTTFYSGDLSNVKMFSTELTAGQILELYQNPEQALPTGASASDLVGWWPLASGSSSFCLNNLQGNKKWGIISGATWITSLPSPVNQLSLKGRSLKAYFNGTSQYFSKNVSNFRNSDNTGSISLWCFISAAPSSTAALVSSCDTGTAGNYYFMFNIDTSGRPSIQLVEAGTTLVRARATNNIIGSWSHVVVTSSGTALKIYINGTLETLAVISGSNSGQWLNDVTLRDNIIIGATLFSTGPTNYFKDILDEVALYSTELSQSDVTALYGGSLASSVNASNLVGYWRNTSISNWTDYSAGGNDLTATGAPSSLILTESTTPSTDLNNVPITNPNTGQLICLGNAYASITDSLTLDITSAITLEAWVKPFNVSSTQTIIGKNNAFALNITSGAKLQFQRWSSTSSGTVSSSASLTANTWTHVAATYDGTNTKIYINGALDTDSTSISGAIDATATDVLLGALTTSTQLFNGYIDSAKIYSDDLSAANVLNNYTVEAGDYA